MSNKDNGNELAALVEGRAATYGLLSRIFEKEVDEELVDQMCAMKFAIGTGNSKVDEANRMMAGFLSKRWERTVEDLSIDFSRTFFGNGLNGYEAAYPLESVHTSEERLMMQDARDEVLALYRSVGLEKDESSKENEDHIAYELFYMKVLSDRCAESLAKGEEETATDYFVRQYTFLIDHLLNWVPLLVAAMQHFSQTDFYRAVALFTEGYLEADEEFLSSVLDERGVDPKSLKTCSFE